MGGLCVHGEVYGAGGQVHGGAGSGDGGQWGPGSVRHGGGPAGGRDGLYWLDHSHRPVGCNGGHMGGWLGLLGD